MPSVNPDNLRWARETAGLDEVSAARKIGLNAARGVAGSDRLRLLESGEVIPTRPLLSKMAATYRRPLIALYAGAPPREAERVEDFRALPDRRPEAEPLVQALVRDVRARQGLVRAVLDDEEAPNLPFVGAGRRAEGVNAVADSLGNLLAFELSRFRAAADVAAAFAYLRGRVEDAGVFVLLIGDLGSYHSEIDTEAFRGFALADPVAPFIVINDRDSPAAWSFTLLHELAHIFLGVTGVSGAHAATATERFCNDVASQILLPADELAPIALDRGMSVDEMAAAIGEISRARRISRALLSYRLHTAELIDAERWETLRLRFADEWRLARAHRRAERGDLAPDARGGGPDYYVVRRQRLGRALLHLVRRALSDGSLTPTKAAKVLGMSPRSVDPLIRGLRT
jgi:Zn-dependent peptidase ImmA (M78 family)